MTKYKEWAELDIDSIEPVEVSPFDKKKVKQHVIRQGKRRKSPVWRNAAAAAIVLLGGSVMMGAAFPSVASQIPFMSDVMSYFQDDDKQYAHFDEFSTAIGLADTSNGTTVMIDNAVYDGTSITVSYAIQTDQDVGQGLQGKAPYWFDVKEASGSGGDGVFLRQISDTRYVGVTTFTPHFEKGKDAPETVHVTWEPTAFENESGETVIEGDWSFEFSLGRIDGEMQLVNESTSKEGVTLLLQSVEKTDISTVLQFEQTIDKAVAKKWPDVSPIFEITDDLGNIYESGSGGGGVSYDAGMTYKWTTTIGTIDEKATKLIIQPTTILSLMHGKGHEELLMDPIEVQLNK